MYLHKVYIYIYILNIDILTCLYYKINFIYFSIDVKYFLVVSYKNVIYADLYLLCCIICTCLTSFYFIINDDCFNVLFCNFLFN